MTIVSPRQDTWLTRPDPRPPDGEYSKLGSRLISGAIWNWPIAHELHNSVLALLSPILSWVALVLPLFLVIVSLCCTILVESAQNRSIRRKTTQESIRLPILAYTMAVLKFVIK